MTELRMDEQMLLEARMANRGPTVLVTYVCWFLGGLFGVHRFYLGRPATGVLMLLTFGGAGIWTLLDLFFIPGMVTAKRSRAQVEEGVKILRSRPIVTEPSQPTLSVTPEMVAALLAGGPRS